MIYVITLEVIPNKRSEINVTASRWRSHFRRIFFSFIKNLTKSVAVNADNIPVPYLIKKKGVLVAVRIFGMSIR